MKWQGSPAVAPPAPCSSPEPALGGAPRAGAGVVLSAPSRGAFAGEPGGSGAAGGGGRGRGVRPAGLTPEAP